MRIAAALVCVLALGACGENPGARERLLVSAAASLRTAFAAFGERFEPAQVAFSFAASDELAAQIRQGGRPDVYAAANTRLPQELHAAGLVEKPVVFASNRLVIAVPARSGLRAIGDLARPGVRLAVGAPTVPIGAYTRALLDRLPAPQRRRVLDNVRTNEPDVPGIVGKVSQRAVDAGFVYATDVGAARGSIEAIELPAALQPRVAYAAAVVRGARNRAAARAFVAQLRDGAGAEALRAAGFAPPP